MSKWECVWWWVLLTSTSSNMYFIALVKAVFYLTIIIFVMSVIPWIVYWLVTKLCTRYWRLGFWQSSQYTEFARLLSVNYYRKLKGTMNGLHVRNFLHRHVYRRFWKWFNYVLGISFWICFWKNFIQGFSYLESILDYLSCCHCGFEITRQITRGVKRMSSLVQNIISPCNLLWLYHKTNFNFSTYKY